MALFGLDFSGILNAVKGFLGPLGKLIDKVKEAYDKLTGVLDSAEKLKDSIVEEVDGWKNFKQDIRLSQRVIQIERAVTKTRNLIAGIPEAPPLSIPSLESSSSPLCGRLLWALWHP